MLDDRRLAVPVLEAGNLCEGFRRRRRSFFGDEPGGVQSIGSRERGVKHAPARHLFDASDNPCRRKHVVVAYEFPGPQAASLRPARGRHQLIEGRIGYRRQNVGLGDGIL